MANLGRNKVLDFATVMQGKLDDNKHKGGWSKCSQSYLVRRLDEEVTEIKHAIGENYDTEDIIKECADVANFAMMIADRYKQK